MTTQKLLNILAANVRRTRLSMGLSQMELAERAEISTGHMNDIERSRRWVSADTLVRLADALGLSPFQLLLPEDQQQYLKDHSALMRLRSGLNESIAKEIDLAFFGIMKNPES